MSTAMLVPETWELDGDDARKTLLETGRVQLARDAFVRLRAADGFSHARSMAFLVSLVLVQGVIGLVGLASWFGATGPGAAIARTIHTIAPGATGKVVTDAVDQAYRAGTSGKWVALVFGLLGALVTGTTLMGQMERALNRIYGVEQDRPMLEKYGRGFLLAVSVGTLTLFSFFAFAFGQSIGSTAWKLLRWPLALVLIASAMALLFRWSPRRHQPAWSWLAFGSGVSVILWSLATLGLGLFVRLSSSFGDAYGPLAGLVALLLWALLSSIAILYGAAIAAQLEAVRSGQPRPRDPLKQPPADRTAVRDRKLAHGLA
ncbi:MAG TPA: YihY/virulence factor BrkB family protein [Acidimicrobiia bacterium]|nr:YihY/virulence factor BrkB family protein [Acidimicrobiia bacterium]